MVKGSRVYKSANNNDHPRSRDAALDISADLQAVMDGVDAKERGMSALQVPLSEAWYHKRKVLVISASATPWSDSGSSFDFDTMSSFEKVVKNACKPKPTPPKSKVSTPAFLACAPNSHCPSWVSTSTLSSPQRGPRMVPSMMSARPFLLAFESQTLSSVNRTKWEDAPG